MGAEEIHVDNFLFTSDSNQVVTGSIYGPPQVWDMTVRVTYISLIWITVDFVEEEESPHE